MQKRTQWILISLGTCLAALGIVFLLPPTVTLLEEYRESQPMIDLPIGPGQVGYNVENGKVTWFDHEKDGYKVQDGKVYWGNGYELKELADADAATFAPIQNTRAPDYARQTWAKDASRVYYENMALPGADAPSFEFFDQYFSKDKGQVYFLSTFSSRAGPEVIRGQDPSSFTPLQRDIFGHQIYSRNNTNLFINAQMIPDADPETFNLVDGYSKDKSRVWIQDSSWKKTVLENADPATFEVIGHGFSKDAAHVYDGGKPMPGVDPTTFQVLSSFYAKDKSRVFCKGAPIAAADPGTFQVLDDRYTKDKKQAYFFSFDDGVVPIDGADPKSFQVLNSYYTKDADRVYYNKENKAIKVVKHADPKTFQVLFDHASMDALAPFAKDDRRVYYQGSVYRVVDPKTFEITSCDRAKDWLLHYKIPSMCMYAL